MQADLNLESCDGQLSSRKDLRGLVLSELEQIVGVAGERDFRARQIANWLYRQRVESLDRMTNLPGALLAYLNEHFKIGSTRIDSVARSSDGTRKLLVGLDGGEAIESVIIPADDRVTLCISSQAGCAMGCTFCATALMGLRRNLEVGEIVGQVIEARHELSSGEELTNYVFMGMGEPLANYHRLRRAITIMTAEWGMGISPRRITVSTVGLVPMMEKLLSETAVNLAVSLAATTNEQRDQLAPINRRYPLEVLIEACRRLPLANRRRITFEYVMLKGVNDSAADASRLIKLLAPLRAKVNLILFNPFEGAPFEGSARRAIEAFQAILHQGNLTATIRESRGRDIAAACGQLRRQSAPAPQHH
ncbi:MAG TPA: 23S rRNA (adenine(2503)-C(2))-methyltransferase RlmN [Candidatus Binataceae bacterium]|nr:23S rRNA (adenine(2503)-C(2))-methyltransferase RlmN [Candidatus Binataceae bacterium]